jgi:hypothetical protein
MIISWKLGQKPIVTSKAIGFKIIHNNQEKIMWIPKSLLTDYNETTRIADVPSWIYDKKVEELFLGGE